MIQHPQFSTAIAAARLAAEVLRKYFRRTVSIQEKGISNFVSQADLEAESAIVDRIHDDYPSHLMLTEESHRDHFQADHLWIVDPLDGTSNFLHGIDHFAISIAYVRRGIAELGVIHHPIHDEWYLTARGQGAWWYQAKQQPQVMRVSSDERLSETMMAVGFYYDRGSMMERTLDAVKDFFKEQVHGVRRFGAAALDLAHVARGNYGSFMEYQLHPWDHAAGGLMVEEAGGRISDCLGRPLSFATPTSILATNKRLHAASLEIAQKHFQLIESMRP